MKKKVFVCEEKRRINRGVYKKNHPYFKGDIVRVGQKYFRLRAYRNVFCTEEDFENLPQKMLNERGWVPISAKQAKKAKKGRRYIK